MTNEDGSGGAVTAPQTVARTLFAGPQPWVSEELYVSIDHPVTPARDRLTLPAGGTAHTNTYFGRFPAAYWQRWTQAREISVSLQVSGPGAARIRLRATDIAGHRRTVATAVTAAGADETVRLTAPLTAFLDGGALFLELTAIDGEAVFADVRWAAHGDDAPARSGLAVAICTFNRADDCAATVAALAADPEVAALIDRVQVTDQGTDHVNGRAAFTEAAQTFGERMHYLRQANLGGAGGFSRGMYEATADPAIDHVLIMDDDVRVEPETVLRMAAFARHTAAPTLVGAQMLYLFNPDYLLASAEGVHLPRLQAGLDADPLGLRDQSVVDTVQERRIDAPYNAWWSCLIPAETIRRIGLPMPYFFQWDDIEYGLRAGAAGTPTVTLPGAAVWHADFYWKDGDDFGQFFGLRNSLITATVHGIEPREVVGELARRIGQEIVSMRYGKAHTLIRAVEAFLEGPEVLADGGQGWLARIRAERDGFPETRTQPVETVPAVLPVRRALTLIDDDRSDLVLAKRTAQQLAGRVVRGAVVVPYEDAHWWHLSLFDEVYVTDGSQSGVRHLRRDAALARSQSKQLAAVLKRFRAEAPAVAERFRAAQPELIGRENWARLFES